MENTRGNVKSEPRDGSLSMNSQDVDYSIGADVSADADDNSFDGYQGADVPLTGGGYVQGYAPHIDIVQNSKGEEDDIKNNGKIFIDADVVNLDLELAKFIIKSVSGGYACQQCGKRCLDKSAARNHVEAKHVTTRGHLCPLCHKFVKTKNGLNNHMYRNHKRASMSPTKNKE